MLTLAGPAEHVRERVAAYRDAGVATSAVTPMAFTLDERLDQLRQMAAIAL